MPKEVQSLIEGYRSFRQQYLENNKSRYDQLVHQGQRPKMLVIACSDSRVDPAVLTQAEPGDLFVIRNVANLVPPYEADTTYYHGTSAALEFGICGLGIRHIVICGHSQCGGISALFEAPHLANDQNSFIKKWMQLAKPARDIVTQHYLEIPLNQQIEICAQQSLIQSLAHLISFPWIRERVLKKSLFLHLWYFDLSLGLLNVFDEQKQQFCAL